MAETILQTIAARTRLRVEEAKKAVPYAQMRAQAEAISRAQTEVISRAQTEAISRAQAEAIGRAQAEAAGGAQGPDTPPAAFPFAAALAGEDIAFICECKKASPSKGVIAEEFPYLQIAREYEQAGAACLSVLTEPDWFLGSNAYLEQIAKTVRIPCLRKDFTVDPYMICEARTLGAAAVLLICSLLDEKELEEYLALTHELGMSALVEAHDPAEIDMAVKAGAGIIGVNNRNLKDFSVDVGNSRKLRSLVPAEVLFVAESGIREPADVQALREAGVDAVLVGETLMRAQDKKARLAWLRG